MLSKGDGWEESLLEDGRAQGKGLVVKLAGCDDRDQAEAMRNRQIAIHRDQLEVLAENEYYWNDLIGLNVRSVDGVEFGRVDHLVDTGSNDVLVVKGDRERLIPFLQPDVVCRVDLEMREIEVDWDPDF